MTQLSVDIRTDDFSIELENAQLPGVDGEAGAVVDFTGRVRGSEADGLIDALFLEHYPGMTEKSILVLMKKAAVRWPILGARVVHRVGELTIGTQIVYVGVTAAHRQDAFDACGYIMDYLKTEAPFWKRQSTSDANEWVKAKDSDQQALKKWQ